MFYLLIRKPAPLTWFSTSCSVDQFTSSGIECFNAAVPVEDPAIGSLLERISSYDFFIKVYPQARELLQVRPAER